jgi:hypothetical protein
VGRFRAQGDPSLSRSFIAKADARALARQVEFRADRGDLTAAVTAQNQFTVGALIRRYRGEVVPRKRSHSGTATSSPVSIVLNVSANLLCSTPSPSAQLSERRDDRQWVTLICQCAIVLVQQAPVGVVAPRTRTEVSCRR